MAADSADVVVIGGGVSGLSSAWFLARAGRDVVVIERGTVGGEASGRNGGMISERVDEPALIPMAVESLRLWPALDDELGYPTEFIQEGRLQVAVTEEEMGQLLSEREVARRHAIRVEVVDPSQIREMIPKITERTLGGIFYPDGGHANPQRTVQAFAWALQDLGGRLWQHTAVTGIDAAGGRVSSVETTAGVIQADVVVAAAGPQTGLMAEMAGIRVPVAPARVEMLATAALEPLFRIALVGNGLYGRQAARGNLLFGGGAHEWTDVGLTADPDKPNTPLIRNIARRLAELLPGAADVPVIRSWAGVVEQAPDYLPVIDIPERPGNYVVVTASAHGFGITPRHGQGRERSGAPRRVEHRHRRPRAGPIRGRRPGLAGAAGLGAGLRALTPPPHLYGRGFPLGAPALTSK